MTAASYFHRIGPPLPWVANRPGRRCQPYLLRRLLQLHRPPDANDDEYSYLFLAEQALSFQSTRDPVMEMPEWISWLAVNAQLPFTTLLAGLTRQWLLSTGLESRIEALIRALLDRPATRAALAQQAAEPTSQDACSIALATLAIGKRPDLVDLLISGGAAVNWRALYLVKSVFVDDDSDDDAYEVRIYSVDAEEIYGLVMESDEVVTASDMLLQHMLPWSPGSHRRFPPAFREAIRTFALVCRRKAPELPNDVLFAITAHLANQVLSFL